jgi:type I restriction enzyme S subunit
MDSWTETTWGELGKLHYGRALRGYNDGRPGRVQVFGTNGPIGWTDRELFQTGIIVGRKGAYRGIHYAKGPCWVIDTGFWLELLATALDPRWAFWQLRTVDLNAIDSGSAIPSTSREAFAQIPVLLPPLSTQRAVASILDTIDDLIENNRRRVEVLEEMARAIYREWFVHFRFPGHEDATFVDSDLGPIPDGWRVAPFTHLASFMNGFAFKPAHLGDEGRVVIKIKQLKEGVTKSTPRSDADVIDERYLIEPGDLLMSWSADLGVYWWTDEPGLLNQHLFKVTSASDYSTVYLLYALDRAMPQFRDRAQGTTMRHIKRAALTEVRTLAPSLRTVERFTKSVRPLLDSMLCLKKSAAALAQTRDLLLPKLVTGQIDVSDLDLRAVVKQAGV